MKIGFDISQTGRLKAGTGYFAHSLINALVKIYPQNDYILYPTFGDFYIDPESKHTIEKISQNNVQLGIGHYNLEEAKSFWGKLPVDFEQKLGDPDIIHSNNFYCPVGLKKARLIYTLHDLAFIENPDYTTEANRIGCFNGVFRASLFADHIIAVSNFSRDQFLDVFPHFSPTKISVIPEGSRFNEYRDKKFKFPEGLPNLKTEHFWLNVGTIEPRKNQVRLIRAYAKLKTDIGSTFPLVIAGGKGWLLEDFENTISALGLKDDVLLLGYVNDNQLAWLYQNCFAFVFPSLYEGFGLPVLEAMSLGAPVITSNTTSLPEVVGDAGLLIDPNDEGEIYKAMNNMFKSPHKHLNYKEQAIKRSKQFSWETPARMLLEIYKQVIKK